MATVYCNDDGSNDSPYDTLAKAATTFLVAVDQLAAGDDLLIGMDHLDSPGGNVTYTFPGTAASPNRVISINTTTEDYDKADNVQVDTSGGVRDIVIQGIVRCYGISLKTGDDLRSITQDNFVLFDDCILELSSAQGQIVIGHSNAENYFTLKNTDVNFSGGGSNCGIAFIGGNNIFKWEGGVLSIAGTQPTTGLFRVSVDLNIISVSGVDLSALTQEVINITGDGDHLAEFHHCKISTAALTSGSITGIGTRILFSGADDTTGNDLYRLDYFTYWGNVFHDDAIFVTTGGASDGTTPISWKMVTNISAAEFSEPLVSPPIAIWIDSTGAKTLTIQCLWDSVTDIEDDEIWLEVEYLSASADTESDFINDGLADILASPAPQTTNSTAWTENLTNDNEFAINVTPTINRVGLALCRVHLAKPSTTVYVDPKVTVT